MKQDKIEEIVEFLFDSGIRAQDIYFNWQEIFDEMVIIENRRKGLLDNIPEYFYESIV